MLLTSTAVAQTFGEKPNVSRVEIVPFDARIRRNVVNSLTLFTPAAASPNSSVAPFHARLG